MSYTPSKRRKEGREAFCPYADPMEFQPYNKKGFNYRFYIQDWLEGWKEAKEAWEQEQKDEEELEYSCHCPKCGHMF